MNALSRSLFSKVATRYHGAKSPSLLPGATQVRTAYQSLGSADTLMSPPAALHPEHQLPRHPSSLRLSPLTAAPP